MRKLIFAACLLLAHPAAAQDQEEVAASAEVAASIQTFAAITVENAPDPAEGTDRFLIVERNDQGNVMLTSIGSIPSQTAMPLLPGKDGIVRIRYDLPRRTAAPLPMDGAYAAEHGAPIFIYNERHHIMWEVGLVGGTPMFREIDQGGNGGDWQAFPADDAPTAETE